MYLINSTNRDQYQKLVRYLNNLCFSFISVKFPKSTQPWDQKKCFMRAVLLQKMSVGGDSTVYTLYVCIQSNLTGY